MVYFIVGKGGTGKSSISVALSIFLSRRENVTLVSIDPAHNIRDIVGTNILNNVKIYEPDIEKEIVNFNRHLTEEMKANFFKYLTVFNREDIVDTLRYSPGTEEYIILSIVARFMEDTTSTLIFDTPPTGLFLKILGLLKSELIWLDRLISIRKSIAQRKSIKNDVILKNLQKQRREMEEIDRVLHSEQTVFVPISLCNELSYLETDRIIKQLASWQYHIPFVLINRQTECTYKFKKALKIEEEKGTPFEISRQIARELSNLGI